MTRSRQTADWGSRAGLAKIVPSSVAVGSGTGSANTLGTVSFSGVSSVSLNGVFSSGYLNYNIVVEGTRSTSNTIYARLRASGSDNSSATYGNSFIKNSGGTPTVSAGASNDAQIDFLGASDSQSYLITMTMNNPFTTSNTLSIANVINGLYSTQQLVSTYWGRKADSTSYDGITFYPSTGTITGTITIYGHN
jgi:hypothetical protein